MWVPWPKVSWLRRLAACDSNDRSGPLTTLPAWPRPLTGAMPESISATPMPWPVSDLPAASFLAHTCGAPIMLLTSRRLVSAASTNQRFLASGAVMVVLVVLVVAASAGPPPASAPPASAPPDTASAADSTPAGHLLPRTDRRVGLVLICSPSGGHRGEGRGPGDRGLLGAHRVLPSWWCIGVAYGTTSAGAPAT